MLGKAFLHLAVSHSLPWRARISGFGGMPSLTLSAVHAASANTNGPRAARQATLGEAFSRGGGGGGAAGGGAGAASPQARLRAPILSALSITALNAPIFTGLKMPSTLHIAAADALGHSLTCFQSLACHACRMKLWKSANMVHLADSMLGAMHRSLAQHYVAVRPPRGPSIAILIP